ncbi:hypothetical protein LZ31DRAFT_549322 [Colletotrichum somersetense]|nr:hypothetical protein LZ31DRAFT_549322 [Colletotrichum somersetense]
MVSAAAFSSSPISVAVCCIGAEDVFRRLQRYRRRHRCPSFWSTLFILPSYCIAAGAAIPSRTATTTGRGGSALPWTHADRVPSLSQRRARRATTRSRNAPSRKVTRNATAA